MLKAKRVYSYFPPRLEKATARLRNKIKELSVKNQGFFRTAKLFY
jgi:hypothetical protein